MASPKNYSLDTVSVSFNGAIIKQGLLNVAIAQESDAFEYAVGAGGEVARIRRIDYRASVTLTLMGTSADNLVLSAFHEADIRTPNGTGVGILYVQQGNDLFIAEKAWIRKAPDRSFGAEEIGDCEWVFSCADLKRVDAGN
jgi:hypothetical protein